jgi:hypothetical protein
VANFNINDGILVKPAANMPATDLWDAAVLAANVASMSVRFSLSNFYAEMQAKVRNALASSALRFGNAEQAVTAASCRILDCTFWSLAALTRLAFLGLMSRTAIQHMRKLAGHWEDLHPNLDDASGVFVTHTTPLHLANLLPRGAGALRLATAHLLAALHHLCSLKWPNS